MSHSNVSSCVLNILGSFASSQGLYKNLKEKRRKKQQQQQQRYPTKRKNDIAEEKEEELRLSRSLRQGSEDIGREYQKSVYAAGDHFAIGDGMSVSWKRREYLICGLTSFGLAIAQTSLAEILLRLNVGLIGIINSFLHNDRNDIQLDYKSLADLSERSRIDTCRTLRQLYKRLTHLNHPKAATARGDPRATAKQTSMTTGEQHGNGKNSNDRMKQTKIKGPTLAQVTIQNSSKTPQIALVRPGDRRRPSRNSSGSDSSISKARSDTKPTSSATTTPPPQYSSVEDFSKPRKPQRKHSEANIASKSSSKTKDHLRATKSTPRLAATLTGPFDPLPPLPEVPNTAPLPQMAQKPTTTLLAPSAAAAASTSTLLVPRRTQKPTPTFYSIASDSTKLGEIPLDKWMTPVDFDRMSMLNREAYRNGWPNEPIVENKRRRAGLFRLFRRRTG